MKYTGINQTKRALLATAIALPMAMAASQAGATAMGYSAQQITNFVMTGTNLFGGFDTFEFNSNDLTVAIGGFPTEVRTGDSCTGAALCPIDLAPIVHSGGINPGVVNNNYFSSIPTLNNPVGDYAISDSNMPTGQITSVGGVFGAMAGAQINGENTARANTGTDNTMFWNFNITAADLANGPIALNFSFDYEAVMFLATNLPGESASGTLRMFVDMITPAGNTLTIAAPYNQTPTITSLNSPDTFNFIDSGTFNPVGDEFIVSTLGDYAINIRFDNRVNVDAEVPEPGTLALLGLGVLGLGAARLRRKAA